MAYYHKLGQIPAKRHTQFRQPDGSLYAEQLVGTLGFSGVSSLLYHIHPPTRIGRIPDHLASIMQLSINVQRQTVAAAVTGKREHIYHAAMLDPHTAAELSLDEIWSLVDRLIEAHGNWLPAYR